MNVASVRWGWIGYAAVLTIAVVLGEASNLSNGAPGAVTMANWILSLALLTALWAYALQRRLGTARYWRLVFFIVAFANAVMLIPVLLTGGTVALVTGGLTLLIVPAYVAAFRYAWRSNELWDA